MRALLEDLGRWSLTLRSQRRPHDLGYFFLMGVPIFHAFTEVPVPAAVKVVVGVPALFVALGLNVYLSYCLDKRYQETPTRRDELIAGSLVILPLPVIALYAYLTGALSAGPP